jgi:hypothetical protein
MILLVWVAYRLDLPGLVLMYFGYSEGLIEQRFWLVETYTKQAYSVNVRNCNGNIVSHLQ